MNRLKLLGITASFSGLQVVTAFSYFSAIGPHQNFRLEAANLDEIEAEAVKAAEEWDIASTPFFGADDAAAVESLLSGLAEVGIRKIPGASSGRAAFVLTNPDMIESLDEGDYCKVLCVKNSDKCAWPNVLDSIGVGLDEVGDILTFERDKTTFLVVKPDVAKICIRLLPKELKGTGVTVSILTQDEIPDGGELQDMEIKRLDKRSQKQ